MKPRRLHYRNTIRAREGWEAYDRAFDILAARRAMFGPREFAFPESFRPVARVRATRAGTTRRPVARRSEREIAVLLMEMQNLASFGPIEGRDRNEVIRLRMAQVDRENRAAAHRAHLRRWGA
jgi:hypothetical protein